MKLIELPIRTSTASAGNHALLGSIAAVATHQLNWLEPTDQTLR